MEKRISSQDDVIVLLKQSNSLFNSTKSVVPPTDEIPRINGQKNMLIIYLIAVEKKHKKI